MNFGRLTRFLPVFLFVGFCLGTAIGSKFPWFIFWAAAFLGALVADHWTSNKFYNGIFILLAAVCLGALWVIPSALVDPQDFSRSTRLFKIKIISLPQEQANSNSSLAEASLADCDLALPGYVTVRDYTRTLEYLRSYQIPARLSRHEFSGREFYFLWVKKGAPVVELPENFFQGWRRYSSGFLLELFKENLSEPGYRFMASVFLGRRELLGDQAQAFTDAGAAHLLAISGSNIAISAAALFFMLRFFWVPYRLSLAAAQGLLWFYGILAGMPVPTLRALLMFSVLSLGFFIRRKVNFLNSLGLAGLFCLLIDPLWLFDVGFQLSFLSVLAIAVQGKIFPNRFQQPAVKFCADILLVSSLVSAFILPLVAYYFGRVYLLTIFYNLLLIPLFTLILLFTLLLIFFSPFALLAAIAGSVLEISVFGFSASAQFLGRLPGSFIELRFAAWAVGLYYAGLIFLACRWRSFYPCQPRD